MVILVKNDPVTHSLSLESWNSEGLTGKIPGSFESVYLESIS